MNVNTANYSTLCETITTPDESYRLATVVFEPSILTDRCEVLFKIFIETYFEGSEELSALAYDAVNRPEYVTTFAFTIFDQLSLIKAMLRECQDYTPSQK